MKVSAATPAARLVVSPQKQLLMKLSLQAIITSALPATHVSGNPLPIAFPKTPMSGVTPKYSCAPPRLYRNPVTVSSKIKTTPYSSAMSRTLCR